MEEFLTACPRNCYSTCSFRVQVSENKILKILPFPGNLATPEGPCIKGLSYIERSSTPARLRKAFIKSENGSFKEINFRDAIEIIAEKLEYIKSKYGPAAVLWYRGSGNSGLVNELGSVFWKYFGGPTTTYGNLCWPAGLEAVKATLGEVKHNVPWDLEHSKTIVIWGKNPAETNIQETAFIAKARKNGAKIIVIDPRRTPTADKADLYFSIRPGTDAALALSVAWYLIKAGRVDYDFIRKNVKGFDQFSESGLPYPETASEICGIPAKDIERLANIIADGAPVTFLPGYGIQRYTNGGQTIRSLLSLAVITGNIGKKGAGFNYANLQSYVFDKVKEPDSYYPDPENDKPFRRSLSMAKLGEDILKQSDPPVRAIWVERGNPLLQSPDSETVRKAFESSEFTVVIEQFLTDTAKMADIILPAKDIFEQPDIIGSYWSPYVQYKPAILKPQGEILPESEIYYHLAIKMGYQIPEALLPGPGDENIDNWLRKRIEGYSALTLEDLKKGPVLAPGLQEIAFSDCVFRTPSGKIELYSKNLYEIWNANPLPVYIPLKGSQNKSFPLFFISPNTASRIHSQFGNLEAVKLNSDEHGALLSPEDASDRQIMSGDDVSIFNHNGSVKTKAIICNRVPPGMVVLYNGIWYEEGGGGNKVTGPEETDFGHGAAFHGKMVEVRKI